MKLNEDNCYWEIDLDEDPHIKDLNKSLNKDELVALVDGDAGGIIGYILRPHSNRVIKSLNKYRKEFEDGY